MYITACLAQFDFQILFCYSSVLSSIFLREKLNILGKMGCALCVIGSTVMVLHSPQEQEVSSMDILKEKIQEPSKLLGIH